MKALRTPEERFANLPGWTFEPKYVEVADGEGDLLRMHYVEEGPADAAPVLMLHGEPSWSYLYRTMIPPVAAAGHRVIAPDLIGFGRSDKPSEQSDYTYKRHVGWITELVEKLDLRDITLFGQDWGALIGLRVVAENEGRFSRVVIGNGFLPTGDQGANEAFLRWQNFSQNSPKFEAGWILQGATVTTLPEDVVAAYDAPFPDETYKAGARIFPTLVPTSPEDPASADNRNAWAVLQKWDKPFLTAFSDGDPITRGAEKVLQKLIPGTADQPHVILEGGGHFLQEDKGAELGKIVNDFIARTS